MTITNNNGRQHTIVGTPIRARTTVQALPADGKCEVWLNDLLDLMDTHVSGFTVPNVLVTPALASALLGIAAPNRKLKPQHVLELRQALREGRWHNTGHPVVICTDRKTWDGQHRLHMIVDEKKPAVIDLRFGVDPIAFLYMDNGRRRTGADTLHTTGKENEALLAATARMVRSLQSGAVYAAEKSRSNMDNDELLDFVMANPMVEEAARIGSSTASAFRAMVQVAPTPLAAAAFLIGEKHGIDVAEIFFEEMRRGEVVANSALSALRDMIHAKKYAGRIGLVAAIIFAWNHQAAKTRKKPALKLLPGEAFPKVI